MSRLVENFPSSPARFGTRQVLLSPFQFCFCQWYSGSLTHTCWRRLVPLSSHAPCTDTAFTSPHYLPLLSPRQGYTLHGPSLACCFHACSAPHHRSLPQEGELSKALMAEAVPTGTAPSSEPRLWPYHAPVPGHHPPPTPPG